MKYLNPGEMESPRQEIMSFYADFIAGLAMDHGTSGSQRQWRSFSNKKG
jgi:hypothetical protein